MTQLALDLLQPLQPSLDNFVAGRNAEALATLHALVARQLPERTVYLWGATGSGRTHLLTALAVLPGAFRWRADLVELTGISTVDDVDTLDGATQIALFNRLNAVRADPACAAVVAGSVPPAQLALREDLRTRLAWGYVYQLHPLTDDEKAAALQAHATSRGVRFDPDVIPYLLAHLPRDMRALVAAVDRLDAWALARKQAVTVGLAREWVAAAQARARGEAS